MPQHTLSDILIQLAQHTSTPTDEFDDPETQTVYTLLDFNADMWTPDDLTADIRQLGINFTTRDADKFLSDVVGIIVESNPSASFMRVTKYHTAESLDQAWSDIECETMRHASMRALTDQAERVASDWIWV